MHQQEVKEIKHYLVLAILYEYALTLGRFCCVLFHQDFIIDSNLLMTHTVAAPWDNHLVNEAFSNLIFLSLPLQALILEYLYAFHKANTVASTSLCCLYWGIRCAKTNASLWLRQFTYFEWGASWRSCLCRSDLSPDMALVPSSPWKINCFMSKPLAQRTSQIFWQEPQHLYYLVFQLIPSKPL